MLVAVDTFCLGYKAINKTSRRQPVTTGNSRVTSFEPLQPGVGVVWLHN